MAGQVQSMTGYGRFHRQDEACSQTWEVRTVNSRYLEVKWRIPQICRRLETDWDKVLRRYLHRGRVEMNLELHFLKPEAACPALDTAQAMGMLNQLNHLAKTLGLEYVPDMSRILLVPSLWRDTAGDMSPEFVHVLTGGLRSVLEDVRQARIREGQVLAGDILLRLGRMTDIASRILPLSEDLPPRRMESLRDRVNTLLQSLETSVDDARLLQELALISDRLDVSEELTRLTAHLQEAKRILTKMPDPGRRLDFLFQECLREITTCGNKTQDTSISSLVIEFKTELEKCREQIQNLE